MNPIKVFTDSTSDLSVEQLKQYDISVIPLYVTFDTESFKDGVEITTTELYRRVAENGKLPMTSAPSPADFIAAFKPHIDAGRDILYVGISSKLSSTIQNAHIAAMEFPEGRIQIVDSLNVHLGIGILAIKGVDFAKEGRPVKEVADLVRSKVDKVRVMFIIDTLEYLHKGGRCSALQSFVGGILKVRPVVIMEDGKIILWEKFRGKREKGISSMVQRVLAEKEQIDIDRFFVVHSESEQEVLALKEEMSTKLEISADNISIGVAGCVISSHCGPKTLGMVYMVK